MKRILCVVEDNKNTVKAEDWAIAKCQREGLHLDLVYIADSTLEHYGEVDILATEVDRADFIKYIQENSRRSYEIYQSRAKQRLIDCGVTGLVHTFSGDVLEAATSLSKSLKSECLVIAGKKPCWSKKSRLEKDLLKRTGKSVYRIN